MPLRLHGGLVAVAGHPGEESGRGLTRGATETLEHGSRTRWEAELNRYYQVGYPGLVAEQHALRGDQRQARDAVRAAFLAAWQRWHVLRDQPDPLRWVAARARQVPTAARRRTSADGWGAWLSGRPGARPADVAVLDALGHLPEVQRRALVPHHMSGVSARLLAEEEGAPLPTIQVRLAHARLALARWLDSPTRTEHEAETAENAVEHPVVPSAQWTSGAIEDWTDERLTQLGQALAETVELEPLASVLRGGTWRRRATTGAVGAVLVSGALGLAIAANLSLGAPLLPTAPSSAASDPARPVTPAPADPAPNGSRRAGPPEAASLADGTAGVGGSPSGAAGVGGSPSGAAGGSTPGGSAGGGDPADHAQVGEDSGPSDSSGADSSDSSEEDADSDDHSDRHRHEHRSPRQAGQPDRPDLPPGWWFSRGPAHSRPVPRDDPRPSLPRRTPAPTAVPPRPEGDATRSPEQRDNGPEPQDGRSARGQRDDRSSGERGAADRGQQRAENSEHGQAHGQPG